MLPTMIKIVYFKYFNLSLLFSGYHSLKKQRAVIKLSTLTVCLDGMGRVGGFNIILFDFLGGWEREGGRG